MQTIEAQRVIPRQLDARMLAFDLPGMLAQLREEKIWMKESRNAITLLKGPDLRMVFILSRAHSVIPRHMVYGPLTIQVIEGRLRVEAGTEPIEVRNGQILTLQPEVRHSITSLEETAFLMTLTTGQSHPAFDFGY